MKGKDAWGKGDMYADCWHVGGLMDTSNLFKKGNLNQGNCFSETNYFTIFFS